VSNRLIMMAREYTAKGEALASQSGRDTPAELGREAPAETTDGPVPSPPNPPDC